jgi:hypothetical protein
VAREDPGCRLSWTLLAGIGTVESGHGTVHGSSLDAQGKAVPPILGPALNGNGFALIRDTDGGQFDGDLELDRAVGPMQFIPGTWARWGADADADGVRDPQDVDDAALAAGRYLCASGGPLDTPAGLVRAVFSYNHSYDYVRLVLTITARYLGVDPATLGVAGLPAPAPAPAPAAEAAGRRAGSRRARSRRPAAGGSRSAAAAGRRPCARAPPASPPPGGEPVPTPDGVCRAFSEPGAEPDADPLPDRTARAGRGARPGLPAGRARALDRTDALHGLAARQLQVGHELGQQRADPHVDVVDDAADLLDVLALRVGDGPVLVALAREDGAGLAAAHRHDDVAALDDVRREHRRPVVVGAQAALGRGRPRRRG